MKPTPTIRAFFALAGSSLLAVSAHAATYYWDNDGSTAGFGTASGTWAAPTTGDSTQGWSTSTTGVTVPGNVTTLSTNATTDAVNFGNAATGLAEGTVAVSGTVNSGNITFAAGSGAIALSGGTITLAASPTITVNNASDTISSVLAGAATTMTKAGTGTLILSGANTYNGNTVVSAGTLRIDGSYPGTGSGTTRRLQVGAASATNGTVMVGSEAGTLTFGGDGYANAAQIGISGGTGALTINGGTVNLAGNFGTAAASLNIGVQIATAAATGTVTVNNGTLNVGQRILMASNNTASSGTLTLAGGTVNLGYNGTLGYTGNNPGVIYFGSGTGTLNLDGGTLKLFGFKSITGASTIRFNGGTLVALGSPPYFMGNNGNSDAAPTASGNYNTVVKSGGAIIDTNGFNISIPTAMVFDPLSTGGGLTKSGAGTLTLSGANTYTGPTLVSGGSLQINGSATTSGITFGGGGTFGFTAGTASTLDLTGKPLSFGGTLALDLGSTGVNDLITVNDFTLTSDIALSFTLLGAVANGGSYTVLTSTNPIVTGGFNLSGQTLGKVTLTPTLNAKSVTVAATVDEGVWNQPVGGDWGTVGNWIGYVPSVAGDAALFGPAITEPTTITVGAPQTLGFLRLDNSNTVTLGSGGDNLTFDNDTLPAMVGVSSGAHVIAENIFLASNLFVGPASGTTLTISGSISGSKSLQLTGAGILVLSGTDNTYSGGTLINSGTLKLSGSATLGAAGSAVSVSSGGLLDLNGTNQSIKFAAGSGAGTVANNSGSGTSTLTLTANTATNVIIQDNTTTPGGKVAVVVAFTQSLNNSNTYSGGTTINAGTFLYLDATAPNGAGTGPIALTALGATGALSSGLLVDGVTYANDITGAGYVHNNSNSGTTVVTTTLTGNINTSGPFIFRAGTGIVYNFAGNGTTSVLSGVIGSTTSMVNGAVATGSIIKSGTGTLTLSGANNYSGTTTINAGVLAVTTLANGVSVSGIGKSTNAAANLVFGAPTATLRYTGSSNATTNRGFTLSSGGGGGATIESSGTGTLTFDNTVALNYGTPSETRLLTLGGTQAGSNTFGKVIADNTSATSVTKTGTGTWVLSASNTYTGATGVNEGTLELADNAQLKFVLGAISGVNNRISGAGTAVLNGDFVIDTTAADALASGSWTLENVVSLTGEYGSTFTVSGFTDAGGNKWTKVNGTKLYTFDEITGVLTLAPAASYAAWAATNAPTTGNNPSADEDRDGVSNGIEYVVGGTIAINDIDKLPGIFTTPGGDMVFTFKRDQDSIDGTTTAVIEVGTTLVSWSTTHPVPDGPVAANPGLSVLQGSPVGFDTVTLVLPRGLDAAKFARLKVTVTP